MPHAAPCRCLGRPNRFEPDRCFTCGRFLPDAIGATEPGFAHTGYMALLHAVNRTADQRRSRPAPRGQHRRVEIEPEEPTSALQRVRGLMTVC